MNVPTEVAKSQSYMDFSAALHNRLAANRTPSNVTIEVTRRCPLECVHCYNNLPMGDAGARREELTYEEHCRLLDELSDAGCLWLLYTGGEIFARHDFLHIYTYAKKKGFLITLFTNGTLITPRVADYLAEWRPFAIEITLYGASKETYENLTGIPGSYERCLRGIRLLRERELPLALKTVAISINKHEIGAMKAFAEDLGLRFKFDAMMTPRIDCSQSPLAVRLQPWEIVKMDLEDPVRVAEWKRLAERFARRTTAEPGDEVYHCGGGVNGLAVDPAGKMSICVLSHQDTYDWRQGNLDQGWNHFLHDVRRRKITRVTKCTSCGLKDLCGMCPANGELENGDPEAPVDFLCHVAHLRAKTMDIAVPAHGACEYCEGGSAYSALLESVATLMHRRDERWMGEAPRAKVFPIVSGGRSAGGGCGSCGSEHGSCSSNGSEAVSRRGNG
jgi:radical SAM protein with 4Fe4S-binding SPASM domain